jgi:hypothetical protein
MSFQFQQRSFLMSILVIVGVVSGGLLVYDILDMRRKSYNGKAEFREKIRKMEDGEPETE